VALDSNKQTTTKIQQFAKKTKPYNIEIVMQMTDMQQNSLNFSISIGLSDYKKHCLQCFDAVGWVAGRASGL